MVVLGGMAALPSAGCKARVGVRRNVEVRRVASASAGAWGVGRTGMQVLGPRHCAHVGVRAVVGEAMEGEGEEQPWLAPSVVNSAPARLALSTVAAVGVAQGASLAGVQALAAAHVLLFATFLGSTVWTTFVAGILMFKNLPRRTFGKLQAKLFPAYFLLASACLVGSLATACMLPGVWSGCPTAFFRIGHPVNNLAAGVALSLLNFLVLEPKATEVMLSRHALQDSGVAAGDDAMKALGAKFGKLHGASSMANLGALCAGVGHVVWMASKLAF